MKKTKCKRCSHFWEYKGNNMYCVCPNCRTTVKIRSFDKNIDIKEKNNSKDKMTRCKEILDNYTMSQILDDYKDSLFIINLLENHENKKEKIGCGIDYIFIGLNSYNNKCFYIKRTDGTEVNFSYIKCIYKKSKYDDLKRACREAIIPYTQKLKNDYFKNNKELLCPVLNIKVNKSECHVDHTYPNTFIDLFNEFIKLLNIGNVEFIKTKKDRIMFADNNVENLWVNYHNKYSNLRLISAKANLSLNRKKNLKR